MTLIYQTVSQYIVAIQIEQHCPFESIDKSVRLVHIYILDINIDSR